jgi:hypothetical protein
MPENMTPQIFILFRTLIEDSAPQANFSWQFFTSILRAIEPRQALKLCLKLCKK